MAASSKYLAKMSPDWIQTSIVDNVHKITSINENISTYTNDEIMSCAQKFRSIVSKGHFEGLTRLAPIINKTAKLSNQKTTQLEPDDQSPDEFLELYEPSFKHSSSQNALYQHLIVAEFDEFKRHKKSPCQHKQSPATLQQTVLQKFNVLD